MKWPVFWLILVNTELGSPENILKSAILEIWVLITTFLNDITLCAIDQGGRTWQAFGGGKSGHETFRQARIYNFRDKCVVFARNLKFSNLTQ